MAVLPSELPSESTPRKGGIPDRYIDELLTRVDIVEIIDRRVPLARKGKEYQACCPFHDERTPSFTVSPAKQFYHCFGCGAHGTAIGFLMKYAHMGFIDAVQHLADGVGLPLPERSPGATERAKVAGDLRTVVAEADQWFRQQLRTDAGAAAVAYLKQRGLDGATAARFGLGYAPAERRAMVAALGGDQGRRELLVRAGLIGGDTGSGWYDRFRHRLMFPIEDDRGRVVGFGGRSLREDGADEAKYLNSPETPLFHKGSELYGLHRARAAIARTGRTIVVEGYMDVVGLAQFGIDNAVATLGTATTRSVQRLFRDAAGIVFCFDGDTAGRRAAWKAMEQILSALEGGRQVSILFLPEDQDPDSFVRTHGPDAFTAQVDTAQPLADFLLDSLAAQVDMGRMDGRARLAHLAQPLITRIPDGPWRTLMSERLTALSGLSGEQLPQAPPTRTPQQPSAPQGRLSPLAAASRLLLQHPDLAATTPTPEELAPLTVRGADILRALIGAAQENPNITTAQLLERFRDHPAHDYLETLATHTHWVHPDARAAELNDTLTHLLEQTREARRLALIEQARRGELAEADKKELVESLRGRAVAKRS